MSDLKTMSVLPVIKKDLTEKLEKKIIKKKADTPLEVKEKHLQAKIKHGKKGRKKKDFIPTELEEAEITKTIKKTLSKNKKPKKFKREAQQQRDVDDKNIVISEFTSVRELANLMDVSPGDIISKFFALGKMVTINQRLDKDSLETICDEFNFEVNFAEEYGTEIIQKQAIAEPEEMFSRPPIVTIMGHVDHGKTSILDFIRSTNVIAGESGGITQHIGAYQITQNGKKITFLDTPGHEAFTAMRARGATVTDIAVIVVAANDGVMPTTIEAIDHAREAGVTIIIAVNKIDLPEASIDRTLSGLSKNNILVEDWGGDILWVPCSAKTGEGIEELLEAILLTAEMKELHSPLDVPAKAVVIESQLDPRMGITSTILMQEGKLKKGDVVVCGATFGKIRKMQNERGGEIKDELLPSDVAVIYGLNEIPKAGDYLNQVENERTARQISTERQHIRQERERFKSQTKLSNLFDKIKENEMTELKIILKADTDGSLGALCDSFEKLGNDEVTVNIIHRGIGGITERDVTLASASDALIIGFHVRPSAKAKKQSEDEGVEIKLYHIIYDAIEDVKNALEGMLAPDVQDSYLGTAEIKELFKVKKIGTIAGCAVVKGTIYSNSKMRVYRDDIVIYDGEIGSLKHYQNDVKEVKSGTDCGISIKGFNDLKVGDVLEAYKQIEVIRTI
ncbi:MAG: translation initiation factor IF-2 [Candidatus Cloacimonetes bacterium]|nr:translation initiation factor IF-2 [Candidatus Cloacimonadota bacterium]